MNWMNLNAAGKKKHNYIRILMLFRLCCTQFVSMEMFIWRKKKNLNKKERDEYPLFFLYEKQKKTNKRKTIVYQIIENISE